MATIDAAMASQSVGVVYNPGFRQIVEDHLTYLREHKTTEEIDIDNQVAYKYHGDLYGVLSEYNIAEHIHWIVMRMNGYSSPMEYTHDRVTLLVPTSTVVNALVQVYRTNKK